MKKTLITLLALSGVAMSATTQFLDLSTSTTVGDLAYNASTGKITDTNTTTAGDLYNLVKSAPETNVIFTLNLTHASAVTNNTKIVELDYNGSNDVGLLATSEGLVGSWNGNSYTGTDNPTGSVTWETLGNDSSVFTGADGDRYITLMLSQWTNGSLGYQINSGSTLHINTPGLGSTYMASVGALYVNNGFVAALEVTPDWKGGEAGCQAATATFNTTAKAALVPEPTTATLSLLALAGLAARRRRR